MTTNSSAADLEARAARKTIRKATRKAERKTGNPSTSDQKAKRKAKKQGEAPKNVKKAKPSVLESDEAYLKAHEIMIHAYLYYSIRIGTGT